MKLPKRRIQWVCLAIAGYFAWLGVWVFSTYGLAQPKALLGAVIGTSVFAFWGLVSPPKEKKEEPIQTAETTRGK